MGATTRRLARVVAVALVPVLIGFTYQSVASGLDRSAHTHRGALVDLGTHQLHLHCFGSGDPVVVLEAPAAGMSSAWGLVQPALARSRRVCSYDRSGLGWSERGDGTFDPARVPEQLRRLLDVAGERGPFVVAGHGLGAAFARLFAARFPTDTVGLVLIDPPQLRATEQGVTRFAGAWPWLARVGLLRASGVLARRADGLPEPAHGALRAFLSQPDHLTQSARELARWDDIVAMSERVVVTIPERRLTTTAPGAVAFLTTADAAAVAVRAIDEVRPPRSDP